MRGLARYNKTTMPSGNIYSFAKQHLTTREFANYIEKRGQMIVSEDSSVFISSSLETRVSDHITKDELCS